MKRNFKALVRQLRKHHQPAYIQTKGVAVAVILSVEEYERLMRDQRLTAFNSFARQLGDEVEHRGLTEEEALADFKETKREVAEGRYGKIG
jgi:PHD/YefM family antitoxin component YafN of YafNO toxin-antitoxin module